MPITRVYNTAITLEATDWLSLKPMPGTYGGGEVGKQIATLERRRQMPGTFPMTRPKTSYLDKVESHLNKLCEIQIGRDLMAELIATGNTVTIRPPSQTMTVNSRTVGCSASMTQANFAGAWVTVREELRQGNAAAARLEFDSSCAAAAAMGYDSNALAGIVGQLVASYNAQQCLNGVAGAPVAIAARAVAVTAADINGWRNGTTVMADGNPVRYTLLALERFLKKGAGTNVTICFDPWAEGVGMLARPPYISLAHELMHARDALRGTRIFDNEPEEECIYIPCGQFGTIQCGGGARKFTENAFRVGFAKTARTLI